MCALHSALARFDDFYNESDIRTKKIEAVGTRKTSRAKSTKGPQGRKSQVKSNSTFRYAGCANDAKSSSKLRIAAEKKSFGRDSELLNAFQMLNIALEGASRCAKEALKASPGLRKALGELLRNEDIDNIAARTPLYSAMLHLLRNIFSNPTTASFMLQNLNEVEGEGNDDEVTVADLLLELKDVSLTVTSVSKHGDSEFRIIDANAPAAIKIAFDVVDTYEAMTKSSVSKLKRKKEIATVMAIPSTSLASSSSPSSSTRLRLSPEVKYENVMRQERFQTIDLCELVRAKKQNHSFLALGCILGVCFAQIVPGFSELRRRWQP